MGRTGRRLHVHESRIAQKCLNRLDVLSAILQIQNKTTRKRYTEVQKEKLYFIELMQLREKSYFLFGRSGLSGKAM